MQKLQLPAYTFQLAEREGKTLIFDEFRKRWISLSPEEWVRRHFIKYLVEEKKFPASLMAVEKKVLINGLRQRFDLLVWDRQGNPLLVAEFKAPNVEINQSAFDQAVRYNTTLKAPFVLVSNGMSHFICKVDFNLQKVIYLKEIPEYAELK